MEKKGRPKKGGHITDRPRHRIIDKETIKVPLKAVTGEDKKGTIRVPVGNPPQGRLPKCLQDILKGDISDESY